MVYYKEDIRQYKKGKRGNGEIKITHDLRKAEGRYTNIQAEVYFTNKD